MFRSSHRPDSEALSALLDGRLPTERAAALREHVVGCAACGALLDELASVKAMLAGVTPVEPSRSFRLRPADVAAAVPAVRPSPVLRFAPAFGAAALVVFAVTLGVDLSTRDGAGGGLATRVANEDFALSSAARTGEAGVADSAAPPGASEANPAPGPSDATPAPNGGDAETRQYSDDAPQPAAPEPEQIDALSSDDGGDSRMGYRVVEVASGAVALAGLALGVALWRRRRGEQA